MKFHPMRELTKTETIKDAWCLGKQARIVGMEETDCPYNHDPILHAAWRKGWREHRPSREFWAGVSAGERARQMKRYGIEVDRGISMRYATLDEMQTMKFGGNVHTARPEWPLEPFTVELLIKGDCAGWARRHDDGNGWDRIEEQEARKLGIWPLPP
jgi:ribosome modulation factor